MRKTQIKIIKKAEKYKFDTEYVDVLSNLNCKISDIEYIYDYINYCRKHQKKEDIIEEVKKYACSEYMNLYLYWIPKEGDPLIGCSNKKEIFVRYASRATQIYENQYKMLYHYYRILEIIYKTIMICEDNLEVVADLLFNIDTYKKLVSIFVDELVEDLIKNASDSFLAVAKDYKEERIKKIEEFLWSNTYKYAENKIELLNYVSINNISSSYDLLDPQKRSAIVRFRTYMEELNKESIKSKYDTFFFECKNREKIEKYMEYMKDIKCRGSVDIRHFSITINESDGFDKYINIHCNMYEYTKVNSKGEVYRDGQGYDESLHITIYPNGEIMEKKGKRIYPLTVKRLIKGQGMFFVAEYLLKSMYESGYYFAKDILEDITDAGCVVPIKVNDIFLCHTRKEYIKNKYPLVQNIKINKLNVNKTYLLNKAKGYVKPDSLSYLYNCIYNVEDKKGYSSNIKIAIRDLLSSVIIDRVKKIDNNMGFEIITLGQQEMEEELNIIVNDYVRMCIGSKRKISLKIRSLNQIRNMHNSITSDIGIEEETGKVEIPKKSVFYNLRKILPDDYEWIKTRKRLIEETKIQHHCVWSYAEKITEDRCAIYSHYDKDCQYGEIAKRYTIEFGYDAGKFNVIQVQGRFDRVNSTNMKNHIEELLKLK